MIGAMRFAIGSILLLLMVAGLSTGCKPESEPMVWTALLDNGDQPSVGFKLVRENTLSGVIYLVDPSEKHGDFTRGQGISMKINSATPYEIRFVANFRRQKSEEQVIRLLSPLSEDEVPALFESPGSAPRSMIFRRRVER